MAAGTPETPSIHRHVPGTCIGTTVLIGNKRVRSIMPLKVTQIKLTHAPTAKTLSKHLKYDINTLEDSDQTPK